MARRIGRDLESQLEGVKKLSTLPTNLSDIRNAVSTLFPSRLVVTPDSVNMLSEACATGRPVHTFVSRPLPGKLERFHQELRAAGLLHDIDARTPPAQTPLRETAAIASEVRRHLGLGQPNTR